MAPSWKDTLTELREYVLNLRESHAARDNSYHTIVFIARPPSDELLGLCPQALHSGRIGLERAIEVPGGTVIHYIFDDPPSTAGAGPLDELQEQVFRAWHGLKDLPPSYCKTSRLPAVEPTRLRIWLQWLNLLQRMGHPGIGTYSTFCHFLPTVRDFVDGKIFKS